MARLVRRLEILVVTVALTAWAGRAEGVAREAVPLSLTSSDGAGLQLLGLRARGVIEGPLAFTELHLTFRNPQARTLEGQFEITLPPGATVSRFAMREEGRWQEGEVVELAAARVAYEDFLHRRQDPALLEKKAGNQFRARVFPIAGLASKELILSYTQELGHSDEPYRILLRGLPRVERLDVRVVLGQPKDARVIELSRKLLVPDQDFVISGPELAAAGMPPVLRHRNLVVARVAPPLEVRRAPLASLLVLLDTSASRAPGFLGQLERLRALIEALVRTEGADLPVRLACFDQSVEAVFEGTAGDLGGPRGEPVFRRILERRALGASDLSQALRYAGRPGRRFARMLLVGDGIATAGNVEPAELRRLVAGLARVGVERLDALVDGGIRDEALLRTLVQGGLPKAGVLVDADQSPVRVAERLGRASGSRIRVQVPGASWVWPTELQALQPGDEALIYADLPPGHPLLVQLDGAPARGLAIEPVEVSRPLLERAWAHARIRQLTEQREMAGASAERRESLRQQITRLSTQHRVLSDFTGLLVLETEADYARFKIDRRALADILVVGPTGLEVDRRRGAARPRLARRSSGLPGAGARRSLQQALPPTPRDGPLAGRAAAPSGPAVTVPPPRVPDPAPGPAVGGLGLTGTGAGGGGRAEGAIGLGRLGTIGRGGGGSGRGYGRASMGYGSGMLRSRRASVPQVVSGAVVVQGSLDTSLIRRVIRRHITRIRYCYERELVTRPRLQGRVVLRFVIGPQGQVEAATVSSSTLENLAVESCVVAAARGWSFPAARGGGVVQVSYPFVFQPSGVSVTAPRARQLTPDPPGRDRPAPPKEAPRLPYEGQLLEVMTLLGDRQPARALARAQAWRDEQPGDVLALVALGEALEALGRRAHAARAYGSIIDLFPARADLRRFAGARLERVGHTEHGPLPAAALAVDTYEKARQQRPDHPSSHRLLAYALLRTGRAERAFQVLAEGLKRSYPPGRFAGVERILREDLGLIGAAWIRQAPARRAMIDARLAAAGAVRAAGPSLRFVLSWETDANDVDFHIEDGRGQHASYAEKRLGSGGELYADVTTGYGPECFAIEGTPGAFPYRFKAHYYARGPMGYGMGKLHIVQHDGQGQLRFEDRAFVVMVDRAFVDLGSLAGPLARPGAGAGD